MFLYLATKSVQNISIIDDVQIEIDIYNRWTSIRVIRQKNLKKAFYILFFVCFWITVS